VPELVGDAVVDPGHLRRPRQLRPQPSAERRRPGGPARSGIRKKAEEAGVHVAGLVEEVDRTMRDLMQAINR